MTYDIFVIYFIFAPTLALTMSIAVSYPFKAIKYFFILSLISSLIFSLYFSFFNYLLISLGIKKLNFYFLSNQETFNLIFLLQFGSLFMMPWFINSLGLLINRFYPNTSRKIINKKGQIKKISFKVIFFLMLSIFMIGVILLIISFSKDKWSSFRILSLNLLFLSPIFLLTTYIRRKKKFFFLTEFNLSSILLSFYIIASSFFVSEFFYDFKEYTVLYPLEDILYTFIIYFLSSEITISIIAIFYDKMLKSRGKGILFSKRKYPFFQKIFSYEEELKETIFLNSEDNE